MTDEIKQAETTGDLVERAEKAQKKLEETEKRLTERIAKLEELEARRILGGKSDAGQIPTAPKVETPQEYKNRVMGKK